MRRIIFVISLILALSAAAAAQGQSACQSGLVSIQGTYVASYQGFLTVPDPTNPYYVTPTMFPGAILGVMTIDSSGNIRGSVTVAGLTEVAEYENRGTLTLNADCTGVMKFTNKDKKSGYTLQEQHKFIVAHNGNDLEIHAIMVDVGPGIVPVVLGKWKRIAFNINAAVW